MKEIAFSAARSVLLVGILAAGIFSILASGGGGSGGSGAAKVTLTAVDCPKAQIELSVNADKKQRGVDWVTTVTATVTCNGSPIQGAQIRVQIGNWFDRTVQTDSKGQVSTDTPAKAGDPSGQSAQVTVQGSDGEKVQTATIK